jgi:hypothetical protein
MSHLAERHSYSCETGIDINNEGITCGIATCPNFEYKDDLEIIIREWKLASIELTKEQADELWGLYSESASAGWIGPIRKSGDAPDKRYSWVRDATREFLPNVLEKK